MIRIGSSSIKGYNEEQIITGYPIGGAMECSGDGRVRKLLDVCLHNNAIVARDILVTNIALWGTLRAIYIVSSVGTSLQSPCLVFIAIYDISFKFCYIK